MGVIENMPKQGQNDATAGDVSANASTPNGKVDHITQKSDSNQTQQQNKPETAKTGKDGVDLNSPEVQKMLSELKSRDMEVKAHEMAHLAAAGQYATSGANYSYQTGPDGKQYAIGGDVGIDTSAIEGNPQATLAKAQQIFSAAMAPAQPSSQDFKVAQSAQNMMSKALSEVQVERQKQTSGDTADRQSTDSKSKEGARDAAMINQSPTDRQKQNQENQGIKSYQLVDIASNSQAGLIGGWQNNANRIGLSFQA